MQPQRRRDAEEDAENRREKGLSVTRASRPGPRGKDGPDARVRTKPLPPSLRLPLRLGVSAVAFDEGWAGDGDSRGDGRGCGRGCAGGGAAGQGAGSRWAVPTTRIHRVRGAG